jgi:hypothetical protein
MPQSTTKNKKKKMKAPSTQAHLAIAETKEDTMILKDGTLRAVLLVSSINFALKSEDEQNALVSSYVGFLNSLDFSIQIVVQSRRMQIQPYIDQLTEIERTQKSELLRVQIADYKAFIGELIELGQIMTKRFYVVVPYDPVTNKKRSFFARFGEVLRPAATVRLKDELFQKRKEDLDLRVRHVIGGLESTGLQTVRLDTQSIIELLYITYNPDIAFAEPMPDVSKIRVDSI